MAKQVWICEACYTPYETEGTAKLCQSRHVTIPNMKIKRAVYKFAQLEEAARVVPEEISVEMTELKPYKNVYFVTFVRKH